jgi:HD-like signal output (HDOD) protein
VLAKCTSDPNLDLRTELTRVFGFDHITAGQALISAWDMPTVLVEALSPSISDSDSASAPAGLGELANNASMLASHIYQGSCEFDWGSSNLDADAYAPAYEQGNQGLERVMAVASTMFPG